MSEPTVLFLLGITSRSGTKYLTELLRRHSDIERWPPLWENYVLERIGPVADFAADITRLWRDRYDIDDAEVNRFIRSLGGGIESFLPSAPPPATSC